MDQGRQAWQPQALLRTLHNIENWDYVLHWIVGCFCVHSPVLHCVELCPLCMAIRAQGNLSMNAAWISESSWTTFWATWYSISLTSYNFTIQTHWKWPRSFHLPGTFTPQEYFLNRWLPNLSPASSPDMLLMWWHIFIYVAYVSHNDVSWQPIASDVKIFSRNRTEAHFWKLNNCLVTSFLAEKTALRHFIWIFMWFSFEF